MAGRSTVGGGFAAGFGRTEPGTAGPGRRSLALAATFVGFGALLIGLGASVGLPSLLGRGWQSLFPASTPAHAPIQGPGLSQSVVRVERTRLGATGTAVVRLHTAATLAGAAKKTKIQSVGATSGPAAAGGGGKPVPTSGSPGPAKPAGPSVVPAAEPGPGRSGGGGTTTIPVPLGVGRPRPRPRSLPAPTAARSARRADTGLGVSAGITVPVTSGGTPTVTTLTPSSTPSLTVPSLTTPIVTTQSVTVPSVGLPKLP